MMRSLALVATLLLSSAALADEPLELTDTQMDQVTAAGSSLTPNGAGRGVATASYAGSDGVEKSEYGLVNARESAGYDPSPGLGNLTATTAQN